MKLTKYKIARIKSTLPKEDQERIEKESTQEGGFSNELKSTIAKSVNYFAPKRLKKQKGAGGHRGLNRKVDKKLKMIANIIAAKGKENKDES